MSSARQNRAVEQQSGRAIERQSSSHSSTALPLYCSTVLPRVEQLRRQLARWEVSTATQDASIFSCGASAIDRLLPGGGLRHGMLIEWLSAARNDEIRMTNDESVVPHSSFVICHSSFPGASGAAILSLLSAREACRPGGTLVVIDRPRTFYSPAAAAWGIDLERLIVVRPASAREELWAAVQALRSPVVAAVWGAIDRLDGRALRRLQLAAQAGHTLGLFLRPASARGLPTWADVQLGVRKSKVESQESRAGIPAPGSRLLALDSARLVQVHVLRTRGGRAGKSATLEIDDAAHAVREINEGDRLSAKRANG